MLQFTDRKMEFRVLLKVLSTLFVLCCVVIASGTDAFAAGAKQTSSQKTFTTPEEAVQALVMATKAGDAERLLAILGPEAEQLVRSGDEAEDKAMLERFARAYDEKNQIIRRSEQRVILEVGKDDWPLPIPIVKAASGEWRFDTRQGKEEILNRRIGRNELSTIQVCLAYVEAQRDYASKDRDGDEILEFAQKFASDPGMKNGLFWEVTAGDEQSPLGPLVGQARKEGYRKKSGDQPAPYHGYFYKILKTQGKNAPRGAYNYVIDGDMIGGFAMVAYPARHGVTGITTFIVSHDGVVYEKNLGKNTATTAQAMTSFNPDKSWHKVKDKHIELPASGGGA
ncbi:MAG: DUF2950 domain-containing protein [Syntrophobacteraceae bacterium]